MAIFYNEGEQKIRPGVYQRHVNTAYEFNDGAKDGICAIPIQAHWGPLGKVVTNTNALQLEENYGSGTYGTGYTVPAAAAMFSGGAATVYTYRMGTGGTAASKALVSASGEQTATLTVTAKYVGTASVSVAVQQKLGDTSTKQFIVYFNGTQVETWNFTADGETEGPNLMTAVASSNYVTLSGTGTVTTVPITAAASGALTGGVDPTVNNGSYSTAFAALEPYYYNTIAIDVNDDQDMTLGLLLKEYLDNAYLLGKLGIAVIGEATTVPFANRLAHAKALNDAKVVYLGGGYMAGNDSMDGVLSICYTAGVIAATPSNRGITHSVVSGATDLCESITYSQYEDAILNGMLMLSMSPDGSIWYDSGITTLTVPDVATQDEGWKKIRRVKVRFELIERLDRVLDPKVGQVSADSDGVSDIIQAGQRVVDAMANNEGKLRAGATFVEDPDRPYTGDSAWFIIRADDIDSLEKIYLQYQFRYTQNS